MSTSRSKKIRIFASIAVLAAAIALVLWFKGDDWFGEKPARTKPAREYQDEPPRPATPENATNAAAVNATEPEPDTDEYEPGDLVTPQFVLDLAQYAASNYHPAGTRHNAEDAGMTTLSFKKLNMRYGIGMTGLDVGARDVDRARNKVFGLILNPIVLRTIYTLYKDEFVDALIREGFSQTRLFRTSSGDLAEREMKPSHVREMLAIYADMARDVGLVFRSFAANPGLVDVMADYFEAKGRVHAAYGEFAALEARGKTGEAMTRVSEEIRTAILAREAYKSEILKKSTPSEESFGLSNGEVMDIASWIYRRVSEDSERMSSIGALASLFMEFSNVLEQAAKSKFE
jgi:hypothetical protein